MIPAGMLSTPIEILTPTITTSQSGEQVRKWDKKFSAMCGTLKRAGRRDNIEGNIAPAVTRSIILHYRKGVTTYDRVRFVEDNEVFMIDSTEPNRRDNSLTLHLRYLDE